MNLTRDFKTYENWNSIDEQKQLAGVKGVAVDAVFDSVSVKPHIKKNLKN